MDTCLWQASSDTTSTSIAQGRRMPVLAYFGEGWLSAALPSASPRAAMPFMGLMEAPMPDSSGACAICLWQCSWFRRFAGMTQCRRQAALAHAGQAPVGDALP